MSDDQTSIGRDEQVRESLVALLLTHGHAEWDEHDAHTVANVVQTEWAAPLLDLIAKQAATIQRLEYAVEVLAAAGTSTLAKVQAVRDEVTSWITVGRGLTDEARYFRRVLGERVLTMLDGDQADGDRR